MSMSSLPQHCGPCRNFHRSASPEHSSPVLRGVKLQNSRIIGSMKFLHSVRRQHSVFPTSSSGGKASSTALDGTLLPGHAVMITGAPRRNAFCNPTQGHLYNKDTRAASAEDPKVSKSKIHRSTRSLIHIIILLR